MRGTDHLFFLDSIITWYSMLHFQWFLIIFCSIVLIEAIVYSLYWKKPVMALTISIIGNICSALVAVPFLILTAAESEDIGEISNWVDIIIMADRIVSETDRFFSDFKTFFFFMLVMLLSFTIALIISIISEVLIVRLVIVKQEHDLKIFTIANSITYICIILGLFSLGGLFGLFNQNPELSAETFYGEWLFVSLDDYVISFLIGIILLMMIGFLIAIILIIVSLGRFISKPTNLPQKNK